MSDKIDVARLARKADTYAHGALGTFTSGSAWRATRDAHLIRLVIEDCIHTLKDHDASHESMATYAVNWCVQKLQERMP